MEGVWGEPEFRSTSRSPKLDGICYVPYFGFRVILAILAILATTVIGLALRPIARGPLNLDIITRCLAA
jgi:hypothetical protein